MRNRSVVVGSAHSREIVEVWRIDYDLVRPTMASAAWRLGIRKQAWGKSESTPHLTYDRGDDREQRSTIGRTH
jgi:hypothetical protein